MFIDLTEKSDRRIMLNVYLIENIYEFSGRTIINYNPKMDKAIIVKEDYHTVKNLIKELSKNQ
jgi:uncharacterized protein YlzI (FlbEa/FlbD family)